jgi:folate-dependent phosphoribosylglycinamide formyltransferase PurN
MQRIAVLASGRGSNLEALWAHLERLRPRDGSGAQIVVVVSDRAGAGGGGGGGGALDIARARGIVAATLGAGGAGLHALLAEHRVELVVLAGYMRLVPAEIVRAYRGRMINVHPALLPAFGGRGMYGARVHRAVLESGARLTGVTVHFVDEVYDHGATIAQWPVPVLAGDTPDTLAARVHRVEHVLYPRAVAAVALERVTLDARGRAAWGAACRPAMTSPAFYLEPVEDDALARTIDAALGR